ncbi:MAG: hypothetical protein HYR91_03360 [Flavobacteriia bacterium]|nr:hypothetical protein [Flavobacteriia bacterium]
MFVCFGTSFSKSYTIPEHLFVNRGCTDFSKIYIQDKIFLEKSVKQLFNDDLLNHENTKAFDLDAKFEFYWEKNNLFWHVLDLNNDGEYELFFNNEAKLQEETVFEIYKFEKGKYKSFYFDTGKLIAYKIHPNTKELILFRHKYPCCSNMSHNIESIRLLNGKINLRKRFFIARPDEMATKLFPKKVNYSSNYSYLLKDVEVRWSAEKIIEKASRYSEQNIISKYIKGTPYRILATEKGWQFVLLCGEPSNENNRIINPSNFIYTHVYGWIKK